MLNELNYHNFSILSSTKNINSTSEGKSYIIAINFIKNEFHKPDITGLEKLLHETNMLNEGKIVKLSVTYSKDNGGDYVLPIKILFNDPTQKYSKKVYFERDLDDSIMKDIQFAEMLFDMSPTNVKRVYM